jgi:predicted negative regulator of RcsB-dependent stress response
MASGERIEMFSPGGPNVTFPLDLRRLRDPDTGAEMALEPTPAWVTQALTAGGLTEGSQAIRVAVIDSGVFFEHSLIRMCLEPDGAADFTGEGPGDLIGHGTITALLVITTAPAPVALLSGKVVPGKGETDPRNLVRALGWAADKHVDFVVMRVGVFRRRLGRIVDCDGTCAVCEEAAAVLATGVVIDVAGGNKPGRLACPATLGRLGVPGLIAHGPPDESGATTRYIGPSQVPYSLKPRELYTEKAPPEQMKRAYQLESTDPAAAADLYRQLGDGPDRDLAAHALIRLGSVLERLPNHPDPAGAAAAYRRVIGLRHHSYTPMAEVKLGNLLAAGGDSSGATTAFRQAMESPNSYYAAMAAYNLGNLLVNAGRQAEAKGCFQTAIASGEPEWIANAGNNLGALLWREGDLAAARSAFSQGMMALHPASAMAALNLGLLSTEMDDLDTARQALTFAAAAGNPQISPRAALVLGDLMASAGLADAARAAYQQAAQSGHPEYGPQARQRLNRL